MSSSKLKQLAEEYINFSVNGVKVAIPYVLVKARWRFGKSSGKGRPEEIRAELCRLAERQSIVLEKLSPLEITRLMRENKIGIECSGFVYQVLASWLKKTKNMNLGECLLRLPGVVGRVERRLYGFKRVRRISADTLTNDLNTIRINTVGEIKIGAFLVITNLFDRKNVRYVWTRTGKPWDGGPYTSHTQDYQKNPSHLEAPRQISAGIRFSF